MKRSNFIGIAVGTFVIVSTMSIASEGVRYSLLKKDYEAKVRENHELSVEVNRLENEVTALSVDLSKTESTLADVSRTLYDLQESKNCNLKYIGEYKCTAYCCEKYAHICGTGSGKTANGKSIQADVTVAVTDFKNMPYGTVIYIEDVGIRIVQDTGSFPKNQIDVAVDTHKHASNWEGQGKHKVYVLEVGELE